MSDDALLNEFNRARSERAFEALVQRHLRLVFATALRQVGDRSLAEEISQQVFLALARKAGRLGGHQTIAGWLYQTTLREAKRALRTELRRQRRDQLALEVGALGHGSADEADGLLPLLDEALASLRESERLAVILRYFEGKSWREVGTELGASEDAVQKRGERALETLGRFFARHGFKVSAAALTTGLTTQASAAVPMTLAGVITQTALVPTASASTMGVLAMHLMNLTKTQTAVATLLVCAAPIAYETSARRAIETEHLSWNAPLKLSQVL
jgi:RNA polymerase sigma factor (sigma-70 family)